MVANKFAFYTLRSMINTAKAKPAADPLNNGFLILGGGEESTDLFTGNFQVARVVGDTYYNTNLKSVIVGNSAPIMVAATTKASGNVSNAIVDSGTNSLVLAQTLFKQILQKLSPTDDSTLSDALRAGYVPMSKLDLSAWPTLTFVLEGALGADVKLQVTPDTYWQTNAPKPGHATAVISGDDGEGKGQSILGLPLMNNYFTIFDGLSTRVWEQSLLLRSRSDGADCNSSRLTAPIFAAGVERDSCATSNTDIDKSVLPGDGDAGSRR